VNRFLILPLLIAPLALASCSRVDPDAPPSIAYGDSLCAECGMIINDDRFGVATIIEGARGPEALLFDDFNCQFNHEREHPELAITRRWARDHATREWLDESDAAFVHGPSIRTPMGSSLAAFEEEATARAFAEAHEGVVLDFSGARETVSAQ
jgi:copper chaperone NosL